MQPHATPRWWDFDRKCVGFDVELPDEKMETFFVGNLQLAALVGHPVRGEQEALEAFDSHESELRDLARKVLEAFGRSAGPYVLS